MAKFVKNHKLSRGRPKGSKNRLPSIKDLPLTDEVIAEIDSLLPVVMQKLRKMLDSKDEAIVLRVCSLLLAKRIPDIQRTELEGAADLLPSQVEVVIK